MSDYRNLIQRHGENLCQHLEPHRVLIRMSNVFTSEEERQILDGATATDRSMILLKYLMEKEPESFEAFIGALEDLGQTQLVEPLKAGLCRSEPGLSKDVYPEYVNVQDSHIESSTTAMEGDMTNMEELKFPKLESRELEPKMGDPTVENQPHVRESAEGASAPTEYFGLNFSSNAGVYDQLAAMPAMTEKEMETFTNNLDIDSSVRHVFKGEKNIQEVLETVESTCPKTDLGVLIKALVNCDRGDLADLLKSVVSSPCQKQKTVSTEEETVSNPIDTKKDLTPANMHISKIPFSKKIVIVRHVSVTCDDGKDWRLAAELMNIENYQNLITLWVQTEKLPFEKVLECWEKKKEATVSKLHEILLAIGHENCALQLEDLLP